MINIYYFNITYNCNQECKFCFSNHTFKTNIDQDMSIEDVKNEITKLEFKPKDKIVINGGEPFINKDIYKMLEAVSNSFCNKIDVYTNGTLIDCNKFLSKTKLEKLKFFIPVHGYEELHNEITSMNNSFNRVLKNLRNIEKHGIKYVIKFILNQNMINENFSIYSFLCNYNLRPNYVCLARENYTKKSSLNMLKKQDNEKLKLYLNNIIKDLEFKNIDLTLLDFPFCFISNKKIDICSVPDHNVFFCDKAHPLNLSQYKKEVLIGKNCEKCPYKGYCVKMEKSYLLLSLKNSSINIELE